MSVHSDMNVPAPQIKLPPSVGILSSMREKDHQCLLDYLVMRLRSGNQDRSRTLTRYADIDRAISTWQRLSKDDAQRKLDEDLTGRNQMIPVNLPILATHLEDSVSFFSEIFAPQARNFYTTPTVESAEASKALAAKMNRDTKSRKYYKELCAAIRTLLKYNVGGLAVRWEEATNYGELAEPGNRVEAIDMYNYIYDPTVQDIARIPFDAEFAARISLKNRLWLMRHSLKGTLQRVDRVIANEDIKAANNVVGRKNRHKKDAAFYKYPPTRVGLATDGADDTRGTNSVDWAAYGAGLDADTVADIEGYEVTEMYCWVNPEQFKLLPKEDVPEEPEMQLWRFIIIDGQQVCFAEMVPPFGDAPQAEIPHYMGYLIQDEMKKAQRSQMELMRPFQRFTSFLMNIYVVAARQNIWGLIGYDPSMFEMKDIQDGDVAGRVRSKMPGRDVRTGMHRLDSATGVENVFQSMAQVMELMRALFPSQALPGQIAGIDRPVTNQVAEVMKGVVRRLHMTARLLDSDMMGPMRLACYRNLAEHDSQGLQGLTEEEVAKVLGSGLSQMNANAMMEQIKEIILALMQNPESAQSFDLQGLFNFWSHLMNSTYSLGDFVRQQPQAQQVAQPTPEAAPVPIDPGLAGGM